MTNNRQERKPPLEPWENPAAKPLIRLSGVVKRFAEAVAVDDVDLDIYPGELFCLLGGSGCGKTTLLRMLAGLEQPTAGTIEIDGQDMASVPAYQRPTNMMFQSYALFPHMTVEANVAYGLLREGVAKAEVKHRVDSMLELTGMSDYKQRRPNQLSGGQSQRVALARALVKRPKLLLLDEPLAALDKKLRERTQFELINIQETLGVAFIVVTHDQEEAMTLASRIAVMDAGKIIQIGEPRQIYEAPNSRFVAEFIGSINMFASKVVATLEAQIKLNFDRSQRQISVPANAKKWDVGQQVYYAIRPEKMRISLEPNPDWPNSLNGTVEDIAYFGDISVYVVLLESGQKVQATKMNWARSGERPITWEDKVYLGWQSADGIILAE